MVDMADSECSTGLRVSANVLTSPSALPPPTKRKRMSSRFLTHRRSQQGYPRITRAVIACIHDDELICQIDFSGETLPALASYSTPSSRARCNHFDLSGIDAFRGDAFFHKSIEGDDRRRAIHTGFEQTRKKLCRQRIFLEPTPGDSFVGVQIPSAQNQLTAF